jgi:hypothetical protein
MTTFDCYTALMARLDADPRHWRAVWLHDTSERLTYLRDPVIKVSRELVRAVTQLDADRLIAFLTRLNDRASAIASQHPEHRLGGEAAALRAMVQMPVFASIKHAMPAITIAGLMTVLLDDLDEATTVFCANCETRLEQLHLAEAAFVQLCPECDRDDPRWFCDIGCIGQDKRLQIRRDLNGAIGDCV